MVRPSRWASSCQRGRVSSTASRASAPQIDRAERAGVHGPAVLAHPRHRGRPVPGGPLDGRQALPLLRVAHLPQQHLGAPQDGGQQVVEVVGHAHRQLAGGPQALRAHELRRLAGALEGHGRRAANPRASVSSSSVNGTPAGAVSGPPRARWRTAAPAPAPRPPGGRRGRCASAGGPAGSRRCAGRASGRPGAGAGPPAGGPPGCPARAGAAGAASPPPRASARSSRTRSGRRPRPGCRRPRSGRPGAPPAPRRCAARAPARPPGSR